MRAAVNPLAYLVHDNPHAREQRLADRKGQVIATRMAFRVKEVRPNHVQRFVGLLIRASEVPSNAVNRGQSPSAFGRAVDANNRLEIVSWIEAIGH
jgi:hypothetical protein